MIDTPLNPTPRMLRQFGGLWIVFFGGLAVWHGLYHERHTIGMVCAALAATVGPLGLAAPRLIRPIFVGWMMLVYPVGWVMSRVVLGILFYGLFTPVGVFFRAVGRDELKLKRDAAQTYWRDKPQVTDKARYLRQF